MIRVTIKGDSFSATQRSQNNDAGELGELISQVVQMIDDEYLCPELILLRAVQLYYSPGYARKSLDEPCQRMLAAVDDLEAAFAANRNQVIADLASEGEGDGQ